jgi:dihydrofolate synthase/folylpolyglutamate synthase
MTRCSEKYNSAVGYLYGLQKYGIKLGLSNTENLMQLLGRPHTAFRSIHIAGTNGKGSTASLIASILEECGLKVGLFTSPHLVSFTERISINKSRIAESDVIELTCSIRDAISGSGLNPTFFEFVTAMAFNYFAANSVDWAVIETGMGGRLDSTNIVKPDLTVITNISLDHCEFLGNSITDVTFEKAGIIKNNVPLITASQIPEVVSQLSGIAESLNSDMHVYGNDFAGELINMDYCNLTFNYRGFDYYNNLSVPFSGRYQLYNACTAVRACELLRKNNVHISDLDIRMGLNKVKLEGRLELLSISPPMILDGAHNPEAASSLASSIMEIFSGKKIILVAGIMDDKNIEKILRPLVDISQSVILTRSRYERSATSGKLREITLQIQNSAGRHEHAPVFSTNTVNEALELARSLCKDGYIILITGSFYTAGEVKEILGHKAILPDLREKITSDKQEKVN